MQFPDLFKVIADYVGFVVDFLAFRGLRDYALKPAVDPVLAAYFVVGVLFAYLLSTARRFPGYEKHLEAGTPKRAPSGTTTAPLKEHSSDMALFIMASMLGAVVVHWPSRYSQARWWRCRVLSRRAAGTKLRALPASHRPHHALAAQSSCPATATPRR